MKLILCPHCHDIFNLVLDRLQTCSCGRSSGLYLDTINAEVRGDAIPIGFNNSSLIDAIHNRPDSGRGSRFEAFIIPRKCASVTEVP